MAMTGAVLIVENEPLVREAMEDILGTVGLTILAACDGREGIATYQARQDEIELVILDMRLPGMDGPDILKALRQINPGVKAIVSSAYDEQMIKKSFGEVQFTGILEKPFSADALLSSVRAVLDQ
jgi:two-component system cell cycle sensor histidine kinase/response regulator CckA